MGAENPRTLWSSAQLMLEDVHVLQTDLADFMTETQENQLAEAHWVEQATT